MFKRMLIANRGEIAVRIIRACKELGIETVAIYSTVDKEALHVKLADEAICVGGPLAKDSYLNIENILSAALLTQCHAIHPGFGFLSENSKFVRLVNKCGLTFVGPSPEIIDMMGNKSKAREVVRNHDIPVVLGSDGTISSFEEGIKCAKKIGYPVLIKASNGGGGKGMRIATDEASFENAYFTTISEAKSSFGEEQVYLEKLITNPKHIEIQIIGDCHQNYVHLYERDCSIQRNYQKVIEEAPCKMLESHIRMKMANDAIRIAKAIGYNSVGTIEYIMDKNQNYYFIEMNTRIQVEHPITEMITGIDIVKEQIRVAAGHVLSFKQDEIKMNGYSIECRINAEDPFKGFRPTSGTIEAAIFPGGFGVRMDSSIYANCTISPFYDSMVGKLIVHGCDRQECIQKMRTALEELIITGIQTNVELHYLIFHQSEYIEGLFDTSFIESFLKELKENELCI